MQSSSFSSIQALLGSRNRTPKIILMEVIQRVGEALHVDRGFIAVRDPPKQRCRIAFVWRHDESVPAVAFGMDWNDENGITDEDPLYRAALACRPSVYVTDIETALPDVLNRAYEVRYFGHRAFIHGHIIQDGQLLGTIELSMIDRSRKWTEADRSFIEHLLPLLGDPIKKFVETN